MRAFFIVLLCWAVAHAGPRRIGGDDGFRVGAEFANATLSPDGRTFALSSEGGFHLLDATSGRVLRSWASAEDVRDLAFATPDRLVVLDGRGWVRTYDTTSGRCVREVLLGAKPDAEWCRASFLARGAFVVLATQVFDSATGQEAAWVDRVETVVAAPDGRRFALVRQAGADAARIAPPTELRTYDPTTGYHRPFALPAGRLSDLAFVPGQPALFALLDERPHLFDLATGTTRPLPLERYEAGFAAPLWSPDGRRLALTRSPPGGLSTVAVWDTRTGAKVGADTTFDGSRDGLAFTPGGRLLAWNRSGLRLDVRALEQPEPPPLGHAAPLVGLAFGPGDTLTTLDDTRVVCRWDVRSGAMLDRITLPCEMRVRLGQKIAPEPWSLDSLGGMALRRTPDGIARFDLVRGRLDPLRATPLAPDSFSPSGRWLLEWSDKGGQLYDTERERAVTLPADERLWPAGRDRATYPFWSPDGRYLGLALLRSWQEDTTRRLRLEVPIVKLPTGRLLTRIEIEGRTIDAEPLFSPDGTTLLLEHDGLVDAFDPTTGAFRRRYRAPTPDGALMPQAVSPDSRLLLASAERTFLLIELATGSVRHRIPWPTGLAWRVPPRFSPDGRWLAVALTDATVLLLPVDADSKPPDRSRLWVDLGSPDASVAGQAVQALAARPDTERWVQARRGGGTETKELPALFWLAELDHDAPERRERARRHLAQRPDVVAEVEGLLTGATSAEVRRSLVELRAETAAGRPPSSEELRRLRIAEALERRSAR